MSKIIIADITDKMKMDMKIGLAKYEFIQNCYKYGKIDNDFKKVYTDFYLKAQPGMRSIDSPNVKKYFEIMEEFSKSNRYDLKEIILKMHNELKFGSDEGKKYEFSFATKLLHTINNGDTPIYDKKVRDYLKKECNIKFKNISGNDGTKVKIILDNWNALLEWYEKFEEKENWISWFDDNFKEYKSISKKKKIDFIIFVCGEYFMKK